MSENVKREAGRDLEKWGRQRADRVSLKMVRFRKAILCSQAPGLSSSLLHPLQPTKPWKLPPSFWGLIRRAGFGDTMAFQVDSTHREAIQAGFGIRTGTKRILILKAYPEMYKNCLASQIIRLEVCIVTKSHSPPVSHHGHELEVLMSKPPHSLPSTAPRMCGDLFYAAHGHPRYHGGCGRHNLVPWRAGDTVPHA